MPDEDVNTISQQKTEFHALKSIYLNNHDTQINWNGSFSHLSRNSCGIQLDAVETKTSYLWFIQKKVLGCNQMIERRITHEYLHSSL